MSERTPAEQNAVDRRRELIAEALDRAASGGVFLNAQGKPAPRLYNSRSGSSISAFNALTLALHSDRGGFRTNLYTPFTEAKKRGESVQAGEKGVPFVWYKWNAFRDRTDKDRTISRQEYNALSEEQKKGFAPVREKEIRTLFNIEQTSLPLSDKAAFEKAMKEHGPVSERGESDQDDKKLRMEVNDFLKAVGENLSPIRKDGIGIAHYDSEKDIIHLPSQKHYDSYPEYVQDAVRQIVTATGHPGRLGRPGAVEGGYAPTEAQSLRERLVVELASAVKMNQLGLPARIADENIPLIDKWKESMEKNPRLMDGMEAEVNNAMAMLYKAEHGVKIEKTNEPARQEAQADRISAKLLMVQDDEGKWAMYVKPENEKGFGIYPENGDIGRFFAASKMEDAAGNRIRYRSRPEVLQPGQWRSRTQGGSLHHEGEGHRPLADKERQRLEDQGEQTHLLPRHRGNRQTRAARGFAIPVAASLDGGGQSRVQAEPCGHPFRRRDPSAAEAG